MSLEMSKNSRQRAIDRALSVRAGKRRAYGWRVRRIKAVLGRRDKAEMAALLARWDRYLPSKECER
jgi:hypothetical protein